MRILIDPDTALRLVVENAQHLPARSTPLASAAGLILAQSVTSDADYPPFDRAMMDGYAVHVASAGKTIPIAGELAAGSVSTSTLQQGTAIEIMTGAPCPDGTELVVPKEDVVSAHGIVTLPVEIKRGQNITPRGSECAAGVGVLKPGDKLTPLAIACLATFGHETVRVYPRPSIGLILTGDELVPVSEVPGPAQIRNSNAPMLAALTGFLGIRPSVSTHAKDTPRALASALEMTRECDVIILTGAVSAGKYDLVPDALKEFGATPVFHKVTQRPGKPLFFAIRGRQLIFGLPGNPLSCHIGFHRYIVAALRRQMGMNHIVTPLNGALAAPYAMKGPRTVFQLARAEHDGTCWQVSPLLGKGSADMYVGARANALLRFEPGIGTLEAGSQVQFEPLIGAIETSTP